MVDMFWFRNKKNPLVSGFDYKYFIFCLYPIELVNDIALSQVYHL